MNQNQDVTIKRFDYINTMDLQIPFINALQLGLVPLVMALVSLVKSADLAGINNRFAPILSLVLGGLLVWLVPSDTWQHTTLAGLVVGCVAAGVYGGTKTVVTGK